jgi:hypothetical protein
MRWLLVIACAGCWTSSPPPPAPPTFTEGPPPPSLSVVLERAGCPDRCPVYKVVIHGDGRVEWNGIANVAAMGPMTGRKLPSGAVLRLSDEIDRARFFERNSSGDLPTAECKADGNGGWACSYAMHVCNYTSPSKLTITRGKQTATVDSDHCAGNPGIDHLEAMIDKLARTKEYIQ